MGVVSNSRVLVEWIAVRLRQIEIRGGKCWVLNKWIGRVRRKGRVHYLTRWDPPISVALTVHKTTLSRQERVQRSDIGGLIRIGIAGNEYLLGEVRSDREFVGLVNQAERTHLTRRQRGGEIVLEIQDSDVVKQALLSLAKVRDNLIRNFRRPIG